jgi:hypothetical protein
LKHILKLKQKNLETTDEIKTDKIPDKKNELNQKKKAVNKLF